MNSLHTFVIPVYGESPYLEACVQSLLAQTATGQVKMATSTPTPYSREIAQRYNISYFVNEQSNEGIASDWNFALSVADTPWVTIAHQDDVYHPDYRKHVLCAVEGKRSALIAFTDYTDLMGQVHRIYSANSFVKRTLLSPFKIANTISNPLLKKMMLMPGCPICCPSVAFNRSVLGGFQFDERYKCALDWEAWLRLASRAGDFFYVDRRLIAHRIHAQSETVNNIDNGTRRAEEKQLLNKIWGRWLAKPIAWLYALGYQDNIS